MQMLRLDWLGYHDEAVDQTNYRFMEIQLF